MLRIFIRWNTHLDRHFYFFFCLVLWWFKLVKSQSAVQSGNAAARGGVLRYSPPHQAIKSPSWVGSTSKIRYHFFERLLISSPWAFGALPPRIQKTHTLVVGRTPMYSWESSRSNIAPEAPDKFSSLFIILQNPTKSMWQCCFLKKIMTTLMDIFWSFDLISVSS